jgi:hypothetical protein
VRLTSLRDPSGSIPLALLASIVTAGLAVVLVASVLQSQQTVRFDRGFTNAVHAAEVGVEEAYHGISSGALTLNIGEASPPRTTTIDGNDVVWEAERLSARSYEVRATGIVEGVSRTVVSTVEQESLFFPGAFGDQLVALNGNSSLVDSYESATTNCSGNADPTKCWGTDPDFGTGNGAIGTNGTFDFAGTDQVRRAILYDWAANPGTGVTEQNPGGSRCQEGGSKLCVPEVLRLQDDPLEYGSDDDVAFMSERLADCEGREMDVLQLGSKGNQKHPTELPPQSTAPEDNVGDPTRPSWDNYYCADRLEIYGDVTFPDATPQTPAVIFVRDAVVIQNGLTVNCDGCKRSGGDNYWRAVRPPGSSLQVYVATENDAGAADVSIAANSLFAGVIYAPRASCGAPGGAAADIYGSVVCRRLDNVGNWQFHFDEVLADLGRDYYSVASWREEPGITVTP